MLKIRTFHRFCFDFETIFSTVWLKKILEEKIRLMKTFFFNNLVCHNNEAHPA